MATMLQDNNILILLQIISGGLLGPLIVGLVIQRLGKRETKIKIRQDAIRDLMTFRGDYGSPDFRRSLNKISIVFHQDNEIRKDVRSLYECINNESSKQKAIERSIVGLIYKLCQKNGFKGLTEYDIDQSFPESKQAPQETPVSSVWQPVETKQEEKKEEKVADKDCKR